MRIPTLRALGALPKGPVKPALALSLHTTKADLRERLLPRPAHDARATDHPIQYQWTLLDGIMRLLTGKYAILNVIPFNTVGS